MRLSSDTDRSTLILRGTGLFSFNQALARSGVSWSTLRRALSIGRGHHASLGQRRAPGLPCLLVCGAVAIKPSDLRAWLNARRQAGAGNYNPMNQLMANHVRRRWVRRLSDSHRKHCLRKKKGKVH